MTIHVYAGPTIPASRVRRFLPAAELHPPVRHGDVLRHVRPGDTVLIIDGLWHQVAPVRHKELLHLLDEGVTVVGAASMGALRAAELHPYGMIGVGWVYQAYRDGLIDADDEVAVIQTPEGRPLSDALVNIRYTLAAARGDGAITTDQATALLDLARALPYQRRTWQALRRLASAGGLSDIYARLEPWRCDIKRRDAEQALTLLAEGAPHPPSGEGWRSTPWRTSFARWWAAAYRPQEAVDGTQVPFAAVLQHAQLYDPGFPARWRQRVLAWISGTTGRTSGALNERAVQAAAARGVGFRHLTADQLVYWLTGEEILGVCQREALLRILVRSARLDAASTIWPATLEEAGDLIDPQVSNPQVVAAAWEYNDQVARTGPHRTVYHLDPTRIRSHLGQVWGIDSADGRSMDAAARDRALHDADGAAEVARPFYLWATRPVPAKARI